ncbi:mitochondrial dicarboxylate carrier-like [Limulus polyphemus]|uniref:Mitochondrial dicarboxylate carrier-like n=1 Tax=Limulus polyphemus TaxID=6850 RepID=A0ABM1TAN0_LIMPO|nr:mitochondrial dicarboxylate carrier-like [Limulus polyphemus]
MCKYFTGSTENYTVPCSMVIVGRQSTALNMPEITTIQYTHQVEEPSLPVIMKKQENRLARWYFGGMASAGAACCTHPLDLLKLCSTPRAALMTVSQLSMYDQIKQLLIQTGYFIDNLITHFASSLLAGAIATTMTQPLDVLKTRTMNAKPGEYKSLFHLVAVTAKLGPLGFFKGYVPAFVRLGPHTIITFIVFEQLRQKFGFLPPSRE